MKKFSINKRIVRTGKNQIIIKTKPCTVLYTSTALNYDERDCDVTNGNVKSTHVLVLLIMTSYDLF